MSKIPLPKPSVKNKITSIVSANGERYAGDGAIREDGAGGVWCVFNTGTNRTIQVLVYRRNDQIAQKWTLAE